MLIEIHTSSFTNIHFKIWSGKWRPFCLDLNMSNMLFYISQYLHVRMVLHGNNSRAHDMSSTTGTCNLTQCLAIPWYTFKILPTPFGQAIFFKKAHHVDREGGGEYFHMKAKDQFIYVCLWPCDASSWVINSLTIDNLSYIYIWPTMYIMHWLGTSIWTSLEADYRHLHLSNMKGVY